MSQISQRRRAAVRDSRPSHLSDRGKRAHAPANKPPAGSLVESLERRTLMAATISTTEGTPFNGLVGTFIPSTEGEPASYFTATINWGDGTTSAGTIVLPPATVAGAAYSVEGAHTYNAAGDLPVTVTVTDLSTNVVSRGDTDVTKFKGSESSPTIAVNPLNPDVQFVASNLDNGQNGLLASYSSDGGKTWSTRIMASGKALQQGGDGLVAACCDAEARFDQYGNLFVVYLDSSVSVVELAISTDGGQTFHRANAGLASTPNTTSNTIVDQPHIAVGPGYLGDGGSIWISYQDGNGLIATTGAPVFGLGQFGAFTTPGEVPGSTGGDYGDVAVGPNGQVTVLYQVDPNDGTADTLFANIDPDGLGGEPFGNQITVSSVNIAPFDPIPASATRAIDAEPKLAWDLSTNPNDQHPGRLYAAYTNATTLNGPDSNIFVRYSDDAGNTWMRRLRSTMTSPTAASFSHKLPLILSPERLEWHGTTPATIPIIRKWITSRR